MYAKRLKRHQRIWWLTEEDGASQPLDFMLDDVDSESFDRMMARLDRADASGPSGSNTLFKSLGDALYEFKLNDPQVIRLYAIRSTQGHVIVYGAHKKNTRSQQTDIARAKEQAAKFRRDGGRHA
ncbi:MAG: type II toxin-antitoxin system RelE/ParE family toxin [Coriobacteriia bacterium]